MSAAISYTLAQAPLKEGGTMVFEAHMRTMLKKQLMKTAEKIGTET